MNHPRTIVPTLISNPTRLPTWLLGAPLTIVSLLGHGVLAPAIVIAQDIQWKQRAVEAKAWDGVMAYDSCRGVSVLFGGDIDNPASVGETMEWDGFAWSMRATTGPSAIPATTGPSARNIAAIAYDSDRGVTVVFGGRVYPPNPWQVSGETWEWNGTTWSQKSIGSGPSARAGHAMVYDSANHCTLLFGGGTDVASPSTMNANSQTWKWDGSTWSLLTTTGPSPRAWHRMAYDSDHHVAVLFGGVTNPGGQFVFQGDTWEWDGSVWTQPPVSAAPSPRAGPAMAYDSARHRAVLFGGTTAINTNGTLVNGDDTWEWDGTDRTWQQRTAGVPSARNGMTMAYDSGRGVTVLNGGGFDTNTGSYETWEWTGTVWTKRISDNPETWHGHAIAYDASNRKTVLFGGDGFGNQTWNWDGAAWTQLNAGTSPSPRANHAMAYDLFRSKAVLFGGSTAAGASNETWLWSGAAWTQAPPGTSPSARYNHALAYDSSRHVTVLFGGFAGSASNNETWEWNGTTWSQPPPVGIQPSPRYYHAMAYDAVRNRTVLFGGVTASGYSKETWLWNGTTWAQPPAGPSPSPRYSHSMAFDSSPGRNVTVLFGGNTNTGNNGETWEWNGTSWALGATPGPAPRNGHAMAFDTARNATVLFGGDQAMNMSSQTWELGVPCSPSITTQPVPQSTCPSGTAVFSVAAGGTGSFSYQWQWQPAEAGGCGGAWVNLAAGDNSEVGGVPVVNATNVGTGTLEVHPLAGYSDFAARAFRCIVTNACGGVTSDAATLSVCAADFDCNAFVNGVDFDDFVWLFYLGDPGADIDHNGFVNGVDFDTFADHFVAGC